MLKKDKEDDNNSEGITVVTSDSKSRYKGNGKEKEKEKDKGRGKGKYASSTENRRLVWNQIVWPLVLELNKSWFSIDEYHKRRDEYCRDDTELRNKVSGGFVSLIVKGLLLKDKDSEVYSIHWKLVPYMRKRLWLDYGEAIRLVSTK